jgi:vacuolar protein-sorting-associated protein 4
VDEQKACDLVKQAIDADVRQDWAEAFKLYKSVSPSVRTSDAGADPSVLLVVRNSLDYFNMAYKCPCGSPNPPYSPNPTR